MTALHPLEFLLRPRSVAIAGASATPGKLGALPLQFLRKFGYGGAIYPVNAKADEVMGIKCYPSLAHVDDSIDLLIVAVAADRIPALLEESAPGQVRFALVLASNYAEAGDDGARAQRELVELASRKGIRLVGPNSVGIVNLWHKAIASISQVFDRAELQPGPVAFVTQSGAVGTAITALAHDQGIGIGYFVSTGNEADLEFSDFCDAFIDDPNVSVIAGYVESVRDGAKFQRVARRALEAGKPIVLVKVGTTDVGGRAVRSHTGALAGSDDVYRAVFSAHGVVRADSIEALIDDLKMFVACPRAGADGANRVAVLSHSGGAGVMMADCAVTLGLRMPSPSDALARTLRARLPAYAALNNPIDMTANVVFDAAVMAGSVQDVAQSGDYDAVMLCVNLIWRQGDALADALAAVRAATDRMLAVAWIAGLPAPLQRLARAGVPVFGDPVRCVRAVATRLNWERNRRVALQTRTAAAVASTSASAPAVGYAAQQSLLEQRGIALARARLVRTGDDAIQVARAVGYPVAVKLIAPSLLHKSDVGAVALGIAADSALIDAVERLLAIPCDDREGILIQKMIDDDDAIELFAGFTQDSVFGPIVLFGLGGVFVEVLRDVVMRPAPFDEDTAARMIRDARFALLLQGARGRPACDIDALAALLARVSTLAAEVPSIRALDLNPVVATPRGAVTVDFKLEIAAGDERGAVRSAGATR